MSRYEVDFLIQQWALEKVTVEQVIGQLLLHLKSQEKRMHYLEREMAALSPSFQTTSDFVGECRVEK